MKTEVNFGKFLKNLLKKKHEKGYSPDCKLSSEAGLKHSGGSRTTVRSPV